MNDLTLKNTHILLIIISLGIFYDNVHSENWNILNIQRQAGSINYLSQSNFYIFGGDIIYRSIDNGENWNVQVSPINLIPDHKAYSFVDSAFGWALRNAASIYKTTNGGISWNVLNIPSNFYRVNGICFINRFVGWISGEQNGAIHTIMKSTNGGINWTIISSPMYEPEQILMVNNNRGFYIPISSSAGDRIGYTTNGGYNWSYQNIGNGQPVSKLYFLDSLRGWANGLVDYVSYTSNGGVNWNINLNSIGNTSSMFFVDSLNGWITQKSSQRYVWKTTNKGYNWSINTRFNLDEGNDVYFKDVNTGWIVTGSGKIWQTTNSGANWRIQTRPLNLSGLDFVNPGLGYAISSDQRFVKSTDRGYSWDSLYALNNNFRYVDFVNDLTGYICGDSGMIGKTVNGGISWTETKIANTVFSTVFLVNPSTGWICGSNGTILKTNNGGLSWINQQSNVNSNLPDCYFIDAQNGYIPADGGFVLKTSNGGENWITLYPYGDFTYYSVHFVNITTGFLVGNKSMGGFPPTAHRILIKTTNGGLTWTKPFESIHTGFGSFNDVFFCNSQTGWIVTGEDYTGRIYKSTNTGENWFQSYGPIGSSPANPGILYTIYSLGEENTWVTGFNSILLSTSSVIGIQPSNIMIPHKFFLSQNYPNPFNPQTIIKFDVPKASFTKLIIFDLLGRVVATLVNEELKPGTYEADWDGTNYSSGVYFYKLFAVDFTETKKMVLMK